MKRKSCSYYQMTCDLLVSSIMTNFNDKSPIPVKSYIPGILQTMTVSECCLIKLLPYILFEKCIYIFALEMTSPGNQHCASCIDTLSFPILTDIITPGFYVIDDIPNICLKNCASALAVPLCHIFDSSFKNGVLPVCWKTAYVLPIHKKGCTSDPCNYRPISL